LKRPLLLLGLALSLACGENGPAVSPRVVVAPLLDSLFVGDTLPAFTATYIDARGDTQPAGPVRWFSSDSTIARVDSLTGQIVGRSSGAAVLSARANGVTGMALLVVAQTLELTLLLDTLYLMPGDTMTVPVAVQDTSGSPPPVWFSTSVNGVFTIDSATGRVTATGAGGPLPFTAHADSVSATGAVEVVQLTDTVGGKASFSVFGTVTRRARAGARAVHYLKQGGDAAFRLSTPIIVGGVTVENILITRPTPLVTGVATLAGIDSISLAEVFGAGADPNCRPPRPWAIWSTQAFVPTLRALSVNGGFNVTQRIAITNGSVISGRFSFVARRVDVYDDPLGKLTVRGTFVAPLITDNRRLCG
jgi:hypothetical protein